MRDLAGAVDHLLGHDAVTSSTVGAVGFCMGGGFVLSLAAAAGEKVSAAVPFYGTVGDSPDLSTLAAQVQGHYGRQDHSIPVEAVELMAARIERETRAPQIHGYDAGHAFVNDENLKGTYSPEAARWRGAARSGSCARRCAEGSAVRGTATARGAAADA